MNVFLILAREIRLAKDRMLQDTGVLMNFAVIGPGLERQLLEFGVKPAFEAMEFGPVWHYGTVEGVAIVTHADGLEGLLGR